LGQDDNKNQEQKNKKMRIQLILFCLTISIISVGQVKTWDKDKGTRSGSMIQYKYKGDLNQIIKKIRKDFGREVILQENISGRQVKFMFKKIEWAEEKLEVLFWAMSNEDKHIVTIICSDKDGNDYLKSDSPSRPLIEEYFDNAFKKKAFSDF
jgi:hypothetical protein